MQIIMQNLYSSLSVSSPSKSLRTNVLQKRGNCNWNRSYKFSRHDSLRIVRQSIQQCWTVFCPLCSNVGLQMFDSSSNSVKQFSQGLKLDRKVFYKKSVHKECTPQATDASDKIRHFVLVRFARVQCEIKINQIVVPTISRLLFPSGMPNFFIIFRSSS